MANSSTQPAPLPWQSPHTLWMAGSLDKSQGPAARHSAQGGLKTEGHAPRRILIVDDDPAILNVWRRVLGQRSRPSSLDHLEKKLFGANPPAVPPDGGFTIDTASQGMEGYQKVISALEESRPYTFALVDMRMPPGWDGLETLLHMLQKDPRLEVAICSAFSDISREEVAQRVGRADLQWLRKPFDLEVARDLARKLGEQGTQRRQSR
jgi:CheY-like chemotaxis protein